MCLSIAPKCSPVKIRISFLKLEACWNGKVLDQGDVWACECFKVEGIFQSLPCGAKNGRPPASQRACAWTVPGRTMAGTDVPKRPTPSSALASLFKLVELLPNEQQSILQRLASPTLTNACTSPCLGKQYVYMPRELLANLAGR